MRITATAKEQARNRILDAAKRLFTERGFENTTTRDLAAAAGIATGTLFNYFPTKESLATTLIAETLDATTAEFAAQRNTTRSLEEELFLHIMIGLRNLRPSRAFIGPVLETALSPFAGSAACPEAEEIRTQHLQTVVDILARHTRSTEPSTVTMHLYWSLYLGVLACWSKDESPHQEETMALLDHATRLFAQSLNATNETPAPNADQPNELRQDVVSIGDPT